MFEDGYLPVHAEKYKYRLTTHDINEANSISTVNYFKDFILGR